MDEWMNVAGIHVWQVWVSKRLIGLGIFGVSLEKMTAFI